MQVVSYSIISLSLLYVGLSCGQPLQDQDREYVGFATLPNQVHRKSVKKGFEFTLMVVGEDRGRAVREL
jgi:hypothetical protein